MNQSTLGYIGDIENETLNNTSFRKVVYTGTQMQLVVMAIKPGDDIGAEVHEGHDQFIRVDKGEAEFVLGEERIRGGDGFAIIIPSGVMHNVTNVSQTEELKLYTLYAPPEHKDGTVQENK